METFDVKAAAAVLSAISAGMEANKMRLIELDRVIGDGDLGLTMTAGFAGAAADPAALAETTPGKLWMKAGMAINRHAPSTMGTLMATGFMRGGKALGDKEQVDARDLAAFYQAFCQGVQERGKAKQGDKTILDSLIPAADAAKSAADAGKNLAETAKAAADAAKEGMEQSKTLMSQHGKAAVFREKTIGLIDPGSAAFCLVASAIATVAHQETNNG